MTDSDTALQQLIAIANGPQHGQALAIKVWALIQASGGSDTGASAERAIAQARQLLTPDAARVFETYMRQHLAEYPRLLADMARVRQRAAQKRDS